MNKRVFGSLELEILAIFQKEKNLSVHDVQKLLGGKDQYTTVMTVLSRLVEKNKLDRTKDKNRYVYFLKGKKHSFVSNYFKQLIDKVFMGKTSSLIKCLIEEKSLDEKELKEIEKIINEARRKK